MVKSLETTWVLIRVQTYRKHFGNGAAITKTLGVLPFRIA